VDENLRTRLAEREGAARPMPRDAPVTKTVFPENLFTIGSPSQIP
jgi:hypothetical protein